MAEKRHRFCGPDDAEFCGHLTWTSTALYGNLPDRPCGARRDDPIHKPARMTLGMGKGKGKAMTDQQWTIFLLLLVLSAVSAPWAGLIWLGAAGVYLIKH